MLKKLHIISQPFIHLIKKSLKEKVVKKRDVFIALAQLALLKRFRQRAPEVKIRLHPFCILSPDYETLSFLIKEKFVFEQYHFEETAESPVIFDCGSSIGISVLYFKSLCPNSEIYSFEPYPAAFDFLQKNISLNNLHNVHCYNLALSFENDEIDFFIPEENSFINAKTSKNNTIGYTHLQVPAKPLSQFLLLFPVVHLVKIDVEGSELEILQDLKKEVLKRNIVKKFIIEYHCSIHSKEQTLNDFLSVFEDNGYKCKFIKERNNEIKSDKLIMAYL